MSDDMKCTNFPLDTGMVLFKIEAILFEKKDSKSGYTKYPCFVCLWDSRADEVHWEKKNWLVRQKIAVEEKNIINEPLVNRDRDRIILPPPLHIKLGLMKQFVKASNKDDTCFNYLCSVYHGLSSEKLKAGIFDALQIRKLIKDEEFASHMAGVEAAAWYSFVDVVKGSLGNIKVANYQNLVEGSHLERFPENLGDLSEEQGKRLHQDIRTMEERYQGRWDAHMLADYCWSLMRDYPHEPHKRNSYKRTFVHD
ncbi:hypothetical protein LOD99_6885 [Oopsacas minuta]|uniref:Uncharacterized protein n=1 Tax=Oopsacas minuta TaxID=111878 RepID=A0AAV7JJN4_9METZ|nr:hypothetical protein LOD99_6885 [Oopsacas minuta]